MNISIARSGGTRAGLRLGCSTIAIIAGLAAFGPAAAQDETSSEAVGELVVTGSRIVRDGFEAPTPVTVVGVEQLQASAPANIADALNQLPIFRGSSSPTTGSAAATSSNSGNFLNLRNLGAARTLILLDSRRFVPSSTSGATDVNLLPQSLVSRVDVVTGGASAAYGSDAVAGVVNFVLDTRFTGVKAEAQYGISDYSDRESYKINLTGGMPFANGRGHIIGSVQHYDADGVQDVNDRPWGAAGAGLISPAGAPRYITTNVNTGTVATWGGLITGCTFAPVVPPVVGPAPACPFTSPISPGSATRIPNTQFNADGEPVPYDAGTVIGLTSIGGDGFRGYSNIAAAMRIENAFTHAVFDLTDTTQVFAEVALSETENEYQTTLNHEINTAQLRIYSGNPFIPAATQAIMTANNIASITYGRANRDWGRNVANTRNNTVNVVVGAKGQFLEDWSWDSYVEYGRNKATTISGNNAMHERVYAAADAVRDPSNNEIVCNVTLTNPGRYPGCVPLNPFGENGPSDEAIDYVTGDAQFAVVTRQSVAAMSVRGEPFSTWAGPVSVALGGEYRKVEATQTSDLLSQKPIPGTGIRGYPAQFVSSTGSFQFTNQQPLSGKYDIREAFFETVVPLAKDLPLAKAIDFNGAVRATDYSTSGMVTTWKAGLTYDPIEDLRFRGTISRDIRAANIAELFQGAQFTQSPIQRDPVTGFVGQVLTTNVGNPNLKPEEADTSTFGVVYRPSWLPSFSASVDYYNINIDGAIGTLNAQQTLDQCAAGSQVACSLVQRRTDGSNAIDRITTTRLNLTSAKTSGVDIELGYNPPVADWIGGWKGDLRLRAVLSYLEKSETTAPGADPVDVAGEVGIADAPRWGGVLSANYDNGPFSLYLQERFIGEGVYDARYTEGVDMIGNDIPSVWYTDVTAKYRFKARDKNLEAFLTINNLFDKEPPALPSGGFSLWILTNYSLYDVIGRYYTTGLRMRF